MLKIAYIINYIVNGGPSNVVRSLIAKLDRTHWDITLITLFGGNDSAVLQELADSGVHIRTCTTLSRWGCLLGQSAEFRQIIESDNFDVLHSHGFIPDILSARLHTRARRVTTLHNNMFEDYLHEYGWLKSRVYIQIHLHYLKKLDACVGCSKTVYDAMHKKLPHMTYIRNGIAPTQRKGAAVNRAELGLPNDARVFIFAGRLEGRKNPRGLVQKFARCHNADEYLLLLGDGADAQSCRELGDDHVELLGFQSDPIAYYQIADVYTSASLSEGFSISVLEALDNGLALLVSDIPSHREVIEMARDVYLGELFTEGTFAAAIQTLRKKQIDREAIHKFKQKALSAKHMAEEYEKIYMEK